MNKSLYLLLAISLAAAPLSGCTAVTRFDKDQLDRLDGYRYREKSIGQEFMEGAGVRESSDPQLLDEDGDVIEFDGEDPLVLFVDGNAGEDMREIERRYLRVDVSDEAFRGKTLGSNKVIALPRADIEATGVRQFSWGRTALLTAGIAAGVLTGLYIVGMNLESDGSSGGGGFDDD
jgi:hypothetical protein